MYVPTNISEVVQSDMFLYNSKIWMVVKVEENIFGQYDVWATPVSVPRPIPDLHLVLEPNSALMLRE